MRPESPGKCLKPQGKLKVGFRRFLLLMSSPVKEEDKKTNSNLLYYYYDFTVDFYFKIKYLLFTDLESRLNNIL